MPGPSSVHHHHHHHHGNIKFSSPTMDYDDSKASLKASSEGAGVDDDTAMERCDQWKLWAKRNERQQRYKKASFFQNTSKSSLMGDDIDSEVEEFMHASTSSSRSSSSSKLAEPNLPPTIAATTTLFPNNHSHSNKDLF